ncbi:Calcium-binding EF hand family protein, putative isoform 2 [Hibiscus syriacus]|uniref:Calcium-binding EF hand family protein, putative isoform 2 n=1 Tax=Hibiscus syriacus TaxID=106335 RepID=A0A6A3CKB2_HIBSY|nr:Calcium-binding EF hand family protein, putative isoform 2 [Hibiscus syriacus]
MAKAMVYTFLAIAFIIILFSPTKRHVHRPVGLNRRLAHRFTFDPLVSRNERWTEDGGELSENIAYDQYFQDDGLLNTSLRLMSLFPLLDNSPKDGKISFEELGVWISQQAIDRLSYRTNRLMSWHDKNGDGVISFGEYLPQFTPEDIGKPFFKDGWTERRVPIRS